MGVPPPPASVSNCLTESEGSLRSDGLKPCHHATTTWKIINILQVKYDRPCFQKTSYNRFKVVLKRIPLTFLAISALRERISLARPCERWITAIA